MQTASEIPSAPTAVLRLGEGSGRLGRFAPRIDAPDRHGVRGAAQAWRCVIMPGACACAQVHVAAAADVHLRRPDRRSRIVLQMNQRVIVFARVPRAGAVKTRLARTVGDTAALAHYRTMLRDTLAVVRAAQVQSPGLDAELCIFGDDRDGECARLAAMHGFALTAQVGASQGERIESALLRALDEARAPVLVGSDVVALTADDLRDAFEALREREAVFAPSEDGGYALVGLSRRVTRLFEEMPWGRDTLMAATRRRLQESGVRWAQLRTLWDVDEEPDLRRWLAG